MLGNGYQLLQQSGLVVVKQKDEDQQVRRKTSGGFLDPLSLEFLMDLEL